jgi:peptidoglycan/LPS O-acetylase OafA/YrhL
MTKYTDIGVEKHGLPFWDSMVWAVAHENGLDVDIRLVRADGQVEWLGQTVHGPVLGVLPEVVSVPLWGCLIAGLYLSGIHGRSSWLDHPALIYLGEISYAVYMVHMIVYTFWFNGWEFAFKRRVEGVEVLLPIFVVLVAASASYHLVEVPGRTWVRRMVSIFDRPRAAVVPAPGPRAM